MSASRRTFLQESLLGGGLAALLGPLAERHGLAEKLLAAAGQAGQGADPVGAHDSKSFWDSFGAAADSGDAPPSGVRGRGLIRKPSADSATAPGRQVDYYLYYTDPKTKDTTLRLATSISPSELLDHDGDISASVNVNGFKLAGEDRATFERLQSAQLRIAVVQNKSLLPNYLDMMAWMSLAGLFPDQSGKLPPLQDLSFDPSSGSGRMKQIALPGGSGQLAVNLSMVHKDSPFLSVLKTLTTEVGRFSPLIGLPAISVTALKGFCSLYGAIEERTTFLLNSMPKPAYATQLAREEAQTQQGLNLVPGDYVLVPNAYSAQLTPYLDKLELRQGYLVPKGSPDTTSVYDLAASVKPDITYLTTNISLKPLAAVATPTPSKKQPSDDSTPPPPATTTPAAKKPAAKPA
jgi:hypothetical protein